MSTMALTARTSPLTIKLSMLPLPCLLVRNKHSPPSDYHYLHAFPIAFGLSTSPSYTHDVTHHGHQRSRKEKGKERVEQANSYSHMSRGNIPYQGSNMMPANSYDMQAHSQCEVQLWVTNYLGPKTYHRRPNFKFRVWCRPCRCSEYDQFGFLSYSGRRQ